MNELWDITIYNGKKEIGHLIINGEEEMHNVVDYMLWLTYAKKEWDFAKDVMEGDEVIIDFIKEGKEVNIYCTNLIPDITIKKIMPFIIDEKIEPHKMNTQLNLLHHKGRGFLIQRDS